MYSGYYYYKPGDTKGGITMKYSNGNTKETGYHSVDSAEDAAEIGGRDQGDSGGSTPLLQRSSTG